MKELDNKIQLENSIYTGLIDSTNNSEMIFQPNLLTNNNLLTQRTKILNSLIMELNNCQSFIFSVAFITSSGIAPLLTTLKKLEEKGTPGIILTGSYLGFTQPEPLRLLNKFPNIDIRLTYEDFHAKGYIFNYMDYSNIIVGSSNLTQSALTTNTEWNLKLSSTHDGKLLTTINEKFNISWEKAKPLNEIIDSYEKWYDNNKDLNKLINPFPIKEEDYLSSQEIKPNKMQKEALRNLNNFREQYGETKAIAISATGTGKTLLAAFDVKQYKPKKFLFLVHKNNIAEKTMKVFQLIIDTNSNEMALLKNTKNYFDKNYLFSTVQMFKNRYKQFSRNYFDYIIIDEAHHIGANNWYKKIINYFTPNFLLGLTATAYRMDNKDVLEYFDYNIATNISLNEALKYKLLAPFHYFGISELKIDGKEISDKTKFNYLISDIRVNHIVDNIKYYTMNKKDIRGLVFCSSIKESKSLSEKFSSEKYGYKTIALSKDNTDLERTNAINKLEKNNYNFIFTYDIFNEGIDIPSVNLVVLLRPTQSSIIFVQQLGRGLRKHQNKEYLTVLDFIGNYKNNFLIPAALSNNKSFYKPELRKMMINPENILYGESTINFDEISKKRIFNSIDRNFESGFLQEQYFEVKKKINRIPKLMDFINNNSISPLLFIDKHHSYWNFKLKVDDSVVDFPDKIYKESLYGLSKYISNGIKDFDLIFLKRLIEEQQFQLNIESLSFPELTTIRMYMNEFYKPKDRKLYGNIKYCTYDNNIIKISNQFSNLLLNDYYKNEIIDLISLASYYNNNIDEKKVFNGFELYKAYRRDEIFKIIGAKEDMTSHSMGYIYVKEVNAYPLFINLHKDKQSVLENLDFNDYFKDNKTLKWQSTINEDLRNKRAQDILNYKKNNTTIYIFVRKWKKIDKKFFYVGKVSNINKAENSTKWYNKKQTEAPIANIEFDISPPISENFFQYLTDLENISK